MKRIYRNAILTGSFAIALAACTDVWDEHYQPSSTLNGEKSLWELISDDSDLDNFESLLIATGYDSLLRMNRSYTVWAPTDEFMPAYIDYTALENAPKDSLEMYKKEIVENHISHFVLVAGGYRDREDKKDYKMVPTLNGKSYHFEGNPGSGYVFANNTLGVTNEAAKNGVLHKLNGRAIYQSNLWEKLGQLSSVTSLYRFLEKDFKVEFNANASVEGPIEDGHQTYLDSVFTESCRWFNEIGQLDREDSLYTMFALSNKAWDDMLEMTKSYFVYPDSMHSLPEKGYQSAAVVQDSIAKEFICRNLVFSQTINKRYFTTHETDTLISNHYSRQLFIGNEADSLDDGTIEYYKLSNGELYVVDQVNYSPFTCWHDTIRIEGESLWYQSEADVVQNAVASGKSIDERKQPLLYESLSGHSIGVVNPESEKSNPRLNFYLNDVLSGYYEVSIVVVPPHLLDVIEDEEVEDGTDEEGTEDDTEEEVEGDEESATDDEETTEEEEEVSVPNKFDVQMLFADGPGTGSFANKYKGTNPRVKEIDGKYYYVSDPTKIDTIVLAKCIKIPYCEYQMKSLSGTDRKTRLQLDSKIDFSLFGKDKDKETGKWLYDNSFRIDQVLFTPVPAPKNTSDVE